MKIKTVSTVLTTNSAGQVVESRPVREVAGPVQDTSGRWQSPVSVEESFDGIPVRFVQDAVVLNSAGQPVAATPVAGGGVVKDKRLLAVDANNFYLNFPASAGSQKLISQKIVRNQGSNDAGVAHEVWRRSFGFAVDTLLVDPSAGGYQSIAASEGASDYALNASPFGGSYHGGETVSSSVMLIDGVAVPDTPVSADFKKFELTRNSTITWIDAKTATVDHRIVVENAGAIEQFSTFVSASSFSITGVYPIMAFTDNRYTELIVAGVTTVMSGSNTYLIADLSVRSIRLRDPVTGNYVDIDFTVDRTIQKLQVIYNSNYSKFYVELAGGVLGTVNAWQKTTTFLAPLPAMSFPFVDSFPGAALSPLWRKFYSTGSNTAVVTGGELVLTAAGGDDRFHHPINVTEPGTYLIEVDYKTDGSYTGAQMQLRRSDTTSGTNPLSGTAESINSLAGATWSKQITIAAGETPWLVILFAVTSGRVIRFRELRVTKLP